MKEEQQFINKYHSEQVQAWTNNYINYTLLKNEIATIKDNINNIKERFISNPPSNDDIKNMIEIQNNSNISNNDNNENIIRTKSREVELDSENISKTIDDFIEKGAKKNILAVSSTSEDISISKIVDSKTAQSQIEILIKNQIKNFINLLDKEINKMHVFYTAKEKNLFQEINLQISKTQKLKKIKQNIDGKELLNIIDSLEYISNLSKELINYVYLNLKALKRILKYFDDRLKGITQLISYSYLKRYLSKQNSDLTYILTFKILDETSLATENLFFEVKKMIISHKVLNDPSNKKIKTDFYNSEHNILNNISEINTIHDKIFSELTEWQNYLNMSLNLPSSSNKSIFKDTSFIGDSSQKATKKRNKKRKTPKNEPIKNNNDNEIKTKINKKENDKISKDINNDDYKFKLSQIISSQSERVTENNQSGNREKNIITNISVSNESGTEEEEDEKGEKEEDNIFKNSNELLDENLVGDKNTKKIKKIKKSKSNITVGSSLFDSSDAFSFITTTILSTSNIKNLRLLLPLVGFYSYSYSIIIPRILWLLVQNDNTGEKTNDDYVLYALAISIPSFGNLISDIYIPKLSEKYYKSILITSSFFVFIYYVLLVIGINEKNIYYILIGRFLLGLSYLKQLAKTYVDYYVPVTNQTQSNRHYVLWTNIGFSIGIGINAINLDWKINLYNVVTENNLITFISGCIFFVVLILVIIFFSEPSKENFNEFNIKFCDIIDSHRLSKAVPINKEEKLMAEINEKEYMNLNIKSCTNYSLVPELNFYINNIENKKKFYFKRIFFILGILLIANQYASENILLLIPRIFFYGLKNNKREIYYSTHFIISIVIFIVFLLSYFIQGKCLEKYFIKTNGRCILMVLSFLILIFNFLFGFLILPEFLDQFVGKFGNEELFQIFLPFIGIVLLIIFTELFHVVTVNLFIELLPSEDLKFCCFKMSSCITIITKLSRISPSGIIILIKLYIERGIDNFIFGKQFVNASGSCNICNLALFGFQSLNYIFCFILCCCSSKLLKRSFMNRVLASKIKDIKT